MATGSDKEPPFPLPLGPGIGPIFSYYNAIRSGTDLGILYIVQHNLTALALGPLLSKTISCFDTDL